MHMHKGIACRRCMLALHVGIACGHCMRALHTVAGKASRRVTCDYVDMDIGGAAGLAAHSRVCGCGVVNLPGVRIAHEGEGVGGLPLSRTDGLPLQRG